MSRLIDADALKDLEEMEYTYFKSPAAVTFYEADKVWEAIENAPTIEAEPAQKWISVKDRLPEADALVLCVGAKGGMFLGHSLFVYRDDDYAAARVPNARSRYRYATYWMPLPKPPAMEEEEDE